ncbi:MAG: phosphatase PAP2 family protein [Chloroflexi bacterium]|nr:MAG: phosphatase PAP2 family protein [Chloroflexota bacterium]TMG07159.1 MAG: phosphatase PAP2 family protein [Chloroflexota bacterium]
MAQFGVEAGALWQRFTARFSKRDLLEGAIVAVAFLLYFGVRGAVIDRPESAYWHAVDIIKAQRALGFFWEDDLNAWVKDRWFWAQAMNLSYFYLHFPLIIAFGIWLYYFRREKYTLTRDAFLASGAIALVVYWLYPVAPPRALPELAQQFDPNAPSYVYSFVDTLQEKLGYAYDTESTRAFVNPYAAMPSLHFGWDLLLGLGIIWAFWPSKRDSSTQTRSQGDLSRWWFLLAVAIGIMLPTLQVFAITMTANHFLLDAVAGGVVALLGIGVAVALQRWVYPVAGRWLRRLPLPGGRRLSLPVDAVPESARASRWR